MPKKQVHHVYAEDLEITELDENNIHRNESNVFEFKPGSRWGRGEVDVNQTDANLDPA